MSDTNYIFKLKEYISQLEMNNEIVDCIYLNPIDYNNIIITLSKNASVNYETPYFGMIDPIMIYGVPIRVSHDVPEGHFIKSMAINPYIPLQVSHIIFNEDGKATTKP